MSINITYETLEKLQVPKPVYRVRYISDNCLNKTVLDIGCYDETALIKKETKFWLHGEILKKASFVVGIDNSDKIPTEGIKEQENAIIFKSDATDIDEKILNLKDYKLVVAGEFIEHIENVSQFFSHIKNKFPGKTMILSTPNGTSIGNVFMGMIGREIQHPDHLHYFSYKILNTLCKKAEFQNWEIIPYHFSSTEMILKLSGIKKIIVQLIEKSISFIEKLFPLLSFGYIVNIKI